jgi:AcrR family transcriptional regulator
MKLSSSATVMTGTAGRLGSGMGLSAMSICGFLTAPRRFPQPKIMTHPLQTGPPAPIWTGMNVHSETQLPKDQKRRQILDAALSLFSDYGFHGASMARLAETASVPVGTIYRHFKSKEELIHALYVDIKRERFAAMFDGYDPSAPLRVRFDHIWRNSFAYSVSHPREFTFAEQYAFSPFLRDAARSIQGEFLTELGKFFGEGYRDGVFKPLPPEILSSLISGPLNALAARAIAGAGKMTDANMQAVIDACWDTISV